MVLHGVMDDVQLLFVSFPVTPFTYNVVAQATEFIRQTAVSNMLVIALCFIIASEFSLAAEVITPTRCRNPPTASVSLSQ